MPRLFKRNIHVHKMAIHEYHGVYTGRLVLSSCFACQATALHVCYIFAKYSLTLLLQRSSFCIVRYFHCLPPLESYCHIPTAPTLNELQKADGFLMISSSSPSLSFERSPKITGLPQMPLSSASRLKVPTGRKQSSGEDAQLSH